jgi:hypothetical protein
MIFSAEIFGENIGVFSSHCCLILKKMIITLVFEKNAKFFAENWQKSQKIVIVTSTPGIGFSACTGNWRESEKSKMAAQTDCWNRSDLKEKQTIFLLHFF